MTCDQTRTLSPPWPQDGWEAQRTLRLSWRMKAWGGSVVVQAGSTGQVWEVETMRGENTHMRVRTRTYTHVICPSVVTAHL